MTFLGAAVDGSDLSGQAIGLDGERDKELMTRVSKGPWSADMVYGNRHKDDPTGTYLSDPLSEGSLQDRYLLTQAQYESADADSAYQFVSRIFFSSYRYRQPLQYDTLFIAGGNSESYGIDSRVVATPWEHHKLLVGTEYQVNTRIDQSNKDVADPVNSLNIEGSGWRAGVYVQDEWHVLEDVTATLGIRADRTDASDATLSPRIGLIWNATSSLVVKAMQGRAIRQPNAFERDYDDTGTSFTQVANPHLDHETIDTLELSIDYRLRQDTNLRLSAYRWTIDKLITLEADPSGLGASQYRSGEDVDARGVELSVLRSWEWGARLRASVSMQRAEFSNSARLDNSPEILGKLNLSSPLPIDGMRVGFELQYYGERQAIDGSILNSYWLSNVLLSTEGWINGLELSLGIYNLLDERYEHPGAETNWQTAFEQDGRKALLSLTYAR